MKKFFSLMLCVCAALTLLLTGCSQTADETDFLLRYPEEITMTVEQEETFIERINQSENNYMIICLVDGKHAGNCAQQIYDKKNNWYTW